MGEDTIYIHEIPNKLVTRNLTENLEGYEIVGKTGKAANLKCHELCIRTRECSVVGKILDSIH